MSTSDSKRKLVLSPGWEQRLSGLAPGLPAGCEPFRILPRSRVGPVGTIIPVEDLAGAESMLDFARQRPISFVGVDCEYRYDRPGVFLKRVAGRDRWWFDPTSIVPLLMSIVLAEVGDDGESIFSRFVIDIRKPGVLGPLGALLGLPVPLIFHFGQGDLFCLWKLGLHTPATVWDTCTAERAFHLGPFHNRYKARTMDDAELARLDEEAEEEISSSCALVPSCRRYGIPHAVAVSKDRLQKSFMDHPDDAPFSEEQRAYAVADAEAVARLYPAQVQAAIAHNALNHLQRVEMDWSVTNSRIIWDGVRVDPVLCDQLRQACFANEIRLNEQLADMGVGNAGSHPDLQEFFRTTGLLDVFREGDSYTFDDDHLEAAEERHAAIPLIRAVRKSKRLRSDKLLTGELVGSDGRLHPEHRALGAES